MILGSLVDFRRLVSLSRVVPTSFAPSNPKACLLRHNETARRGEIASRRLFQDYT